MQPSDGMILVIGPRLEGHSVIFLAIQTHLSCRFLLAVDSLGLRRSGSSSQIINQAQDFPEQVPRHRHLTHAAIYNTFNVQRHLITRKTMRQFRGDAMNTWRTVTAAA